jgi:hypothetical protein
MKNKLKQHTAHIAAYAASVIKGVENAKTTKQIAADLTTRLHTKVTPRDVQLKIKPILLDLGISVGTSRAGLFACQSYADFRVAADWYNTRIRAEQKTLATLADNFIAFMVRKEEASK